MTNAGPPYPVVTARTSSPLWPIVLVTVFFALFGLIPTVIATNRASRFREDTSRYWVAFVLSLIGSFVLYGALAVLLVFVILATSVTVLGAAAQVVPSIAMTGNPAFPTGAATGAAPGGAVPTTGPCHYTPTVGVTAVGLPDDPATTPTATRTWTLATTAGTVVVRLDGAAAPCTVQSIVFLTRQGFFDHTDCPRTVDSSLFLVQCGDPSGNGSGGPGYTFGDEDLAAADYATGAVAMANSGPDTNGSQFFLVARDANSALPKSYTVFGRITSGIDVVDKIVAAGNDGSNPAGGGRPKVRVTIVSATVS